MLLSTNKPVITLVITWFIPKTSHQHLLGDKHADTSLLISHVNDSNQIHTTMDMYSLYTIFSDINRSIKNGKLSTMLIIWQ